MVTTVLDASYRIATTESFYISLSKLKEKMLKATVTLPALDSNLGRQYKNLFGTLIGFMTEDKSSRQSP